MADTTLEVIISARDQFTGTANRIIGTLGRMQGSAGQVGRGMGQLAGGLARVGAIAATAAAGGLIAAAKAGADFEAQLRTINTIARADDIGLTRIGDGIRKLAREGRGDLADLSAGFYDVLSAGITDTTKALSVLDAASTLAIGGLSTNAEAVDILTTAINAYGQDASMAAKDADLFAKAIEIGKVKANEIAASFANVAPIAAQTGIEIEEIAAAYGALTAQGTPAAEVTTQMQRAILDLLNPGKELLELQGRLGVSFFKIAQDKGLVVALQAMREAVGDDDAAFKELFGRVEGYKFALQTTGPQQRIYNDALKAMGKSAGTAAAQMGERQQGLAFQVAKLKANVLDAALTVSAGFLPALTRATGRLTSALQDTGVQAALTSLGEDIGRVIDGIDWDKVLDGAREFWDILKGAASVAMAILRTLNALPTEIKAAGVGFIGLNKLSGGLIGQGLGNIAGGLAGGATRGLASRIPGIGSVFAQPVFVTNWPMGGLGGAGGPGGVGGKGGASLLPAIGAAGIVTALAVPAGVALREALNDWRPTESQAARERAEAAMNPPVPRIVARNARQPIAGAWAGISGGGVGGVPTAIREGTNAQLAAMNRVYDAVERNRSAIAAITVPAPLVTVNVDVSARSVVRSATQISRAGNTTRLHAQ